MGTHDSLLYFPQVQTYLNQQINRRQPDTNVKFYKGRDHIQQMAYNALRAKDEILGYTYRSWLEAIGPSTHKYFWNELVANQIRLRDIYSDEYLKSMQDQTNSRHVPDIPYIDKLIDSRYIPSSKLKIDHQLDIYNDVIALYTWKGDDIFGVEIYNSKVASMQRQIFNLIWPLASPSPPKT